MVPLFLIGLLAMSPVNVVQIEDWPELTITEHATAAFPDACAVGAAACALVNLAARTCDVYLSPNWPLQQALREHELEHCRGRDHAPFNLKAAHEAWVAAGKPKQSGAD